MPKIRNILIFTGIAAVLILVYIFLIKPASSSDQANLVSSPSSTTLPSSGTDTSTTDDTSSVADSFLSLLLNVKNIQLNTDIFSDPAFTSLHDSSIVLVPDATTGRPDPFAQFGAEDNTSINSSNLPATVTPNTTNPPSTNNSPADTTASLGN